MSVTLTEDITREPTDQELLAFRADNYGGYGDEHTESDSIDWDQPED
jgi:hypothetical protein